MSVTYTVLVIVILILIIVSIRKKSGFDQRPNSEQIKNNSVILYNNRDYISKGYNISKKKMKWIDPIIYEESRKLHINNNYNIQNIHRILSTI